MHPNQVLFSDIPNPALLPVVEHYAGNERYIQKALIKQKELHGAFDLTLDLEDGASIGNETAQAQLFGDILASQNTANLRIGVRIHEPTHPHFPDDITHVLTRARQAPAYWMIPKVTSLSQTQEAITQIHSIHAKYQIRPAPIHILIETHGALHECYAIAQCPEIQSLSFGLMDFVSAHHGSIPASAMTSPQQFDHPMIAHAKLAISRACSAHGKIANHNVTTDYQTTGAAYQDARRARDQFGYRRMWSIHPNQIDEIIRAFAPDPHAIEQAAQLLHQAQKAQWGPIAFEGKLHDRASYRHYWWILQRAYQTHSPLPSTVAQWFESPTQHH